MVKTIVFIIFLLSFSIPSLAWAQNLCNELKDIAGQVPDLAKQKSKLLIPENFDKLDRIGNIPELCKYFTENLIPSISETANKIITADESTSIITDDIAKQLAYQTIDENTEKLEWQISLLEYLFVLQASVNSEAIKSFVTKLQEDPKLSPRSALYGVIAEAGIEEFSDAIDILCNSADSKGFCSPEKAERLQPYRHILNSMPSEIVFFAEGSASVAGSAKKRIASTSKKAINNYLEGKHVVALIVTRTSKSGSSRVDKETELARNRAINVAKEINRAGANITPRIVNIPNYLTSVWPITVKRCYVRTVRNILRSSDVSEIGNISKISKACHDDTKKAKCIAITEELMSRSSEVFFLPIKKNPEKDRIINNRSSPAEEESPKTPIIR